VTILIETSDITPDVETTDHSTVTTIVTQDVGDGTQPPVTSVVTMDTGPATTIEILEADPVLQIDISEAGVPGPPGIPGPSGPAGPEGPPGGGAAGMTFVQDMPSTEWVIPHDFPYSPSVTVMDTTGSEIETEILQAPGVVTIRTVLPTAGRAYLI
jgi:hypothetical protein